MKLNAEMPWEKKHSTRRKEKLVNCYIWNGALHGAGNWTYRKVDQK
jgi:hypothetical protein